MSTFTLSNTHPPVPVRLPPSLTRAQLLSFPAFTNWLSTLQHSLSLQRRGSHGFHDAPYRLRAIDVQAVDFFGGERVGFVKLRAEVANERGETLPGAVFLRGGSVAMMLILQPDDTDPNTETDKQVILTQQARIPAGSLHFAELPAGMLDDSGTFAGAAASEIAEETGLQIASDDLINLSELAIPPTSTASTSTSTSTSNKNATENANEVKEEEEEEEEEGERLQRATYPSPGGSDEFVPIFLWQKRVPRAQLGAWEGKLTGLRERGEKITLRLCPLGELWRVGARDAKALAAWALYDGLRRERRV